MSGTATIPTVLRRLRYDGIENRAAHYLIRM